MARITLAGLGHAYRPDPKDDADYALQPMDFAFEDGGAYALLGPSGCGKTTLLNIISGLLRPSHGQVLFNNSDVTTKSPGERNIAQVFQFPVVYDTMSVYDNLAFPLRNRGVDEAAVKDKVDEVAEMLELGPELRRPARGLGADAKQKISLGRGLVRPDVAAILFDEPLTVIDPHLKWLLRRKLKQVHERYRRTLVYVTHDQNEALTFAEKIVVMHAGRVMQVGTPQELFERPAHRFVGWFIGSPGMNFIPLERTGTGLRIRSLEVELSGDWIGPAAAGGGAVEIGIRPEHLQIGASPGADRLPVEVERVEDLGNYALVTARLGDNRVMAKVAEDAPVATGPAYALFPPEWSRIYVDGRLVH
ncbi:ABC transporter ATP-binding protein [Geminicoccus roseus]|uniref:ABC transporter ATP-binding protein n=1 Tax=Geminicoccus roseus TaxID=404900 RepID=UPI00041E732E|nr:ABC transporter ATP-binding protein [Geminicoccus roseus]